MFPLLLSVSQSLPLPLIVHPALFIEHWNCITTITETVCMDTCITPQKKTKAVCGFCCHSRCPCPLISNNHFRLFLWFFPVVLFVEDPAVPHTQFFPSLSLSLYLSSPCAL